MGKFDKESPVRFVVAFLLLFVVFFYFNIFFFSITSHGKHYNAFIDEHLNYIRLLRHVLLGISAQFVNWFGYTAITNDLELLVVGRGTIQVVYSCLGLGIMSFFAAFVIAYPRDLKAKLIFLLLGIVAIQTLNILRFVLLAIFWDKKKGDLILDHHTIFNIIIYVIIAVSIYFWIRHDDKKLISRAKN